MSQATSSLQQQEGDRESPPTASPSSSSSSPWPPGSLLASPRQTLFQQGAGDTFRVPALLYLPPGGTFLAFAERRGSPRDEDAKHLVMRRGQRQGHSVQWGPLEDLSALVLPGHRTMNPCPLYDARTGTVFLFCICVEQDKTEAWQLCWSRSAARLCCSCSADAGRSWAPLRDLTHQALGTALSRWATFGVGPGHGVQLASGRLVVPAYAYYVHWRLCGALPLPCSTRQHSLVFYSDDGGHSWHRGSLLAGGQTGECQVAELSGGDAQRPLLYCSARARGGCRAVAVSADGGVRFGQPGRCQALSEPPRGCQGSVVSFSSPAGSGRGSSEWLLYSHPTNRRRRSDLGIYLSTSPLDGAAWGHPWVLQPGPAAYSDLASCPGGVFGCLFECGTSSSYEEIAFCLFSLGTSTHSQQDPEADLVLGAGEEGARLAPQQDLLDAQQPPCF